MQTPAPPFFESLRAVAHRKGLLLSDRELSDAVRALSDIYNREDQSEMNAGAHLAARLLFSFERDRPKGAQAIREIAHLLPRDELRVLDVGAGVGAMAWGAYDSWRAHAKEGAFRVTSVDLDPAALALGLEIARERLSVGDSFHAQTLVGGVSREMGELFHLVLAGQVLSEMDRALEEDARAEKHASILTHLSKRLLPGGYLVVIEPALRERTRHLHRVRERVAGSLRIVAPCLHSETCPMLANPHDWCHEDRAIDLPEHLIPIARGAGLRYQGLTFSYLIVSRDTPRLVDQMPAAPARVRLVSSPRETKGKTEFFLCGELAPSTSGSVRARLLDRETSEHNEALTNAVRGDLFLFDEPLAGASPRIAMGTQVTRFSPGATEK